VGTTLRQIAIAGVTALASMVVIAQTVPPARKVFEIASIKRNNSGPPRVQVNPFVFSSGGRFIATNVTLADVIQLAYGTRRIQMRGGPDWIDSERFNIVAKADESEADVPREQLFPLVQALLEERFKLALHRETEDRTVYALVPGKTPPKLQAAKEGEKTAFATGNRGQMNFQKMPMEGLANTLANILHTPVVDGTGLTGFFDFTLDPMQFANKGVAGGVQAAPDIFADLVITALREQLGFKLEKQKASLEITVIDRAEQPRDN
jgi:uncharacterized protein (TIGR03435 family)